MLALLAERLAARVPFEMEQALAAQFSDRLPPPNDISRYLQGLADRMTAADPLPPGMKITVHFVDEPTVNAFATLGGHVVVYRGLLEAMPNENALAMVLAHEIAHVRLRHPATSMGRGVAVSLGLSVVSAGLGDGLAPQALGSAGLLTELNFSREQELEADAAGLASRQRALRSRAWRRCPVPAHGRIAVGGRASCPGVLQHPSAGRGADLRHPGSGCAQALGDRGRVDTLPRGDPHPVSLHAHRRWRSSRARAWTARRRGLRGGQRASR